MATRIALLVLVASAATAHAQAPGQVPPQQPPPAANPCGGCEPEPVMAHRWAIGFAIGSTSLGPANYSDSKTDFLLAELAVRLRATRRFELALTFAGGSEHTPDGAAGDLRLSAWTLGGRFRLMPEEPWNLYLMLGFGGTAIVTGQASDAEVRDAMQRHIQLGVGVERRFHQFALEAELKAVSIDATNNGSTVVGTVGMDPLPPIGATDPGPTTGAILTLGAAYYF